MSSIEDTRLLRDAMDFPDFPDAAMPPVESARHRRLVHLAAAVGILTTAAYLGWRVTSSLAGATLWLAVPLLVLEAHALVSLLFHTGDLWDLDAVPPPPVVAADDVTHRIAVLVPTYNEPREVLLPTLAAAAALEPAHQTWVLDDGGRPWVRELAAQLGITYRAREDHAHAKAGNVNAVLPELDVDLVAVLDADHVVAAGFLREVVGYFDDPHVALVQTPQDFYNLTSFEHVERPRGRRYAEQALFYRGLAAGRNRWGSAFWCGTNAVLRLAALRDVGGVATETVTEDIHTTIRLHQKGWRSVYHNAVLARGLAAADATQYLNQRLRWGTGAMQVLRAENPARVPGLRLMQRVSYLSTLLGWFDSWRTLGYLLLPLATVATGALPVAAPARELLPWFAAALLAQRLALSALSRGRAPVWQSTVFELIRLPATLQATTALFVTRPRAFSVTAKGRGGEDRARVPAPRLLVVLTALHVLGLAWWGLCATGHGPVHYRLPWVAHGAAGWLAVNGVLLAAALRRTLALRYGSDRRAAVRFELPGGVQVDGEPARLRDLSLTGLQVSAAAGAAAARARVGSEVRVTLPLPGTTLDVRAVVRSSRGAGAAGDAASAAVAETVLGLELVPDARAQAALALALFRTGIAPRLVPSSEPHLPAAA